MCGNESLRSMMCIMCVIWNVNVLFLVLLPFYTLFELVVVSGIVSFVLSCSHGFFGFVLVSVCSELEL